MSCVVLFGCLASASLVASYALGANASVCRLLFECRVHPPRPVLPVAAGNFVAFARDTRGAITLDWMTLSAGLAVLAVLVVATFTYFDLLNGEALAARVEADGRAHAASKLKAERVDPGAQYAPGTPVFDPGGRDPGALDAPPTLPSPGAEASDPGSSSQNADVVLAPNA